MSFAGKQVAVIGDTPSDVACGEALGVKSIAVATGVHSLAELEAAGADLVFPDFADWRAAYEAILA